MATAPRPLPPGWEARWDPNQRAYFYIDHSTKKTSWQHPTIGQPQSQQYGGYTPHQQHHQAAQSLSQQTHGFSGTGQGQNIAMTTKYKQFGSTITTTDGDSDEEGYFADTDFDHLFSQSAGEKKVDLEKLHMIKQSFPSAPEEVIKKCLLESNNVVVSTTNKLFNLGYKREAVTHHPPPKLEDIMQRLKAMFPTAAEDIIAGVLAGANNDEKDARTMLEGIGFKTSYPQTHRSTTPTRQKSPAKKATSPVRRTPSPKPESPPKPSLSESQKKALERQLHGKFPAYDMSVVEMALKVCNYEEVRARAVLERMGDDSKKTSRPSTSKTRTRSPSPKPFNPASLEPVSIFDDSSSRPSTSTSTSRTSTSTGRTSHSSSSKTSVGSRPSSSKTTVTSTKRNAPPPKQQQRRHQARAKKVTEMSKDILSSTIHTLNDLTNNVSCCGRRDLPPANQRSDASASSQSAAAAQSHDLASTRSNQQVVSRQPQRAEYHSECRTEAKGPDPTLCAGPNKNLLLNEYTLAKGPNPELREGPDRSRVKGSMGAIGPDRSLHCGPENGLCKGPSRENLLVTAI